MTRRRLRQRRSWIMAAAFVILGLARELLFRDAWLATLDFTPVNVALIICVYGGLGALVALFVESILPESDLGGKHVDQLDNQVMLQQDTLDTIGLMTAGMAHNFRNYLEVMQATSETLDKHSSALKSVAHALTLQKKAIKQARKIVDQLMYFAKREVPEEAVSRPLNGVLDDAVQLAELLVKEKRIEIIRDFQTITHEVAVDDISLMQSVLNLIKNAAEASAPNSQIIVSTDFTAEDNSYELRISVKDFGSGINAAAKEQLFEPLQHSRPQGSGLGLYTVKHLVEREGGRVEINSEEGQGTEVILHYPAVH